ncbi:hypothetical protein ACFJI0_24165 [Hydrogenophaga sp. UC242_53]
MPHEKVLRRTLAKPPARVASLSCQSASVEAIHAVGPVVPAGTGRRIVTGVSKAMPCGVNS